VKSNFCFSFSIKNRSKVIIGARSLKFSEALHVVKNVALKTDTINLSSNEVAVFSLNVPRILSL